MDAKKRFEIIKSTGKGGETLERYEIKLFSFYGFKHFCTEKGPQSEES